MGLFYTGKGDKGKSVIGKKKVDKTCVEMLALGEYDELNSLVGVIRSQKVSKQFKDVLREVQENLFILQANIGVILFGHTFKAPPFKAEKVRAVEQLVDAFEREVKPARGFIIAGDNHLAAWCDYARAVSRRAERSLLQLAKKKKIPAEILAYANRLSSLFFALGRVAAKRAKAKESHPTYK